MKRTSVVICLVLGAIFAPWAARAGGSTLQITSPSAGSSVRGTVRVAATADPSTTSVTFDWSKDGGTTWLPIGVDPDGSDGWSEQWDTTGYDGTATLRATATATGGPAVATEDVTVDNTAPDVTVRVGPGVFSPNGDHRLDRTAVRLTVSEPSTARVRVLDRRGNAVATIASGLRVSTGTTRVEWNGRHGARPVADGGYTVEATSTDEAGNTGRGSDGVRVDTTPPTVRWVSVRPETVSHGSVTAKFGVRDTSGIAHAALELLDEAGVYRTSRVPHPGGAGTMRVAIRRFFMPGLYRLRLVATDGAGNTRVSPDLPLRVVHPVRSTVWRSVPGAGPRVALTFDDCNDGAAWNRILDVLSANHLHTTFFCIGGNVERYSATARRTIALGNSVGDHTWDHQDLVGHTRAFDENELRKQAGAWWRVARATPLPYFRPPYGAYDATAVAAAGALGFSRTVLWDVDPQDWRRPGASVIASKVLGAIHPGAIVVMHVQDQTAEALPSILAGLRRRHLLQSSLPELFAAARMR